MTDFLLMSYLTPRPPSLKGKGGELPLSVPGRGRGWGYENQTRFFIKCPVFLTFNAKKVH